MVKGDWPRATSGALLLRKAYATSTPLLSPGSRRNKILSVDSYDLEDTHLLRMLSSLRCHVLGRSSEFSDTYRPLLKVDPRNAVSNEAVRFQT